MKRAVSISLGSSSRDHKGTIELGGETIEVQRIGTNGDTKRMQELYRDLDGKVDAFGAGGFLFGFHVEDRFYELRTVKKLVKYVEKTPIVDGNGVKDTIERHSLQSVWPEIQDIFENKPKTALVTSAVDRYGMAKSVAEAGFDMVCGDFYFALGIPIKVRTLKGVQRLARMIMPLISFFPLSWLYPLGEKQDKRTPKHAKLFKNATLIAGDFLYTKKYSPDDMKGKIILTNTTTQEDRDDLFSRGVEAIITTTPEVGGRSFGTNVLEAAIVAHKGLGRALSPEEMRVEVEKLGLKPQVHFP
ncbi:MAG: quinate 5-dehydrogenase [Methanobacteriota archaeon]|nr:MAG: quinate 5-dehydrogenase [Euryarchaeota archaeon]